MASDPSHSPSTPMRVPLNRSVSQASWSEHHNAGTSYASSSHRPTSPSPRRPAVLRRPSGRPNRSMSVGSARAGGGEDMTEEEEDDEEDGDEERALEDADAADEDEEEEDEITLKQRQSLINVEHPFGLPIWKPALYKKTRSVTRDADQALHEGPSAQAERHLLPVNIAWTALAGWWLALVCFAVALVLCAVPRGGRRYARLVFGLGWYLGWPFGKYVEGTTDEDDEEDAEDEEDGARPDENGGAHDVSSDDGTVRGASPHRSGPSHMPTPSWSTPTTEATSLLAKKLNAGRVSLAPIKSYGTTTQALLQPSSSEIWLGRAIFWLFLVCLIAPLMLAVCVVCWALIVAIPMAKLNWALLTHLCTRDIRFCSPPELQFFASNESTNVASPEQEAPAAQPILEVDEEGSDTPVAAPEPGSTLGVSQPRLTPGSRAPSSPSNTKVLLCIYRAAGLKFYKYTVGGVNILFVNLLPVVVLVILDGFFLMPWVEAREARGKHVPAVLAALGSQAAVFTCSLLSVIPLSYFIGMAVASISAQSSIGMGAVINATFGSIIEILLYAIALRDGKGGIVEGSIVGSILAGVLLMPGLSMLSGAMRKKEQKFNAKSAGVTSTMLIMAIIGTLTPTLFYQTYGNFMLVCTGCPTSTSPNSAPWVCQHCSYQHPDPIDDPFYKQTVIKLTYFCATVLLFSYIVALWFSLRTHASQIWQNPQQLLHPSHDGRLSLYHKIVPPSTHPSTSATHPHANLRHKPSFAGTDTSIGHTHGQSTSTATAPGHSHSPLPPTKRMPSYAPNAALVESVGQAVHDVGLRPTGEMSADDLTRAIAVATVSALRQAGNTSVERSAARHDAEAAEGHGGHDAPSWSRTTSASVLLGCTALYAIIAELLVDVVDVVLKGSGIQQKFLGITLFALVPNTTEFMNAMSFAVNGNIALSMEIGSAYALQVCLLQIPAMVAFSAWYAPSKMGRIADTFPLIFPRWDVLVIILSVFLLTYVYIEAKSNYHRGSILVLSYCVLVAGFYFAPKDKDFAEFDGRADTVVVRTHFVRAGTEAVKMWLAI